MPKMSDEQFELLIVAIVVLAMMVIVVLSGCRSQQQFVVKTEAVATRPQDASVTVEYRIFSR